MPYGTATGVALVQVVRDGQAGNTVTVNVVSLAPQIVAVTDTAYDVRDATHPTTAGETLILWAIGLGPTNPQVPTGVAAPLNPPALVANTPVVVFANSTYYKQETPSFAGLSGGSAGLYQVIVTVPPNIPKGVASVQLDSGYPVPLLVQ